MTWLGRGPAVGRVLLLRRVVRVHRIAGASGIARFAPVRVIGWQRSKPGALRVLRFLLIPERRVTRIEPVTRFTVVTGLRRVAGPRRVTGLQRRFQFGGISLVFRRERRLPVAIRVPAEPRAEWFGVGRPVMEHGLGRIRVIRASAPAAAEHLVVARVVAEYLRRIVIRGHGSPPSVPHGWAHAGRGSSINPSLRQFSPDFDTLRTGLVAMSRRTQTGHPGRRRHAGRHREANSTSAARSGEGRHHRAPGAGRQRARG